MESLNNVFNVYGDGQFVNTTVTRKRIEDKVRSWIIVQRDCVNSKAFHLLHLFQKLTKSRTDICWPKMRVGRVPLKQPSGSVPNGFMVRRKHFNMLLWSRVDFYF